MSNTLNQKLAAKTRRDSRYRGNVFREPGGVANKRLAIRPERERKRERERERGTPSWCRSCLNGR